MDIQNNQTQELFEKLYVKNAPSWALERDSMGLTNTTLRNLLSLYLSSNKRRLSCLNLI